MFEWAIAAWNWLMLLGVSLYGLWIGLSALLLLVCFIVGTVRWFMRP